MDRTATCIIHRLVLTSGEKCWYHRLGVDGLLLFPADWNGNAQFPQDGPIARSVGSAVRGSAIKEHDLSIQSSDWMLVETRTRVADFVATKSGNGELLDSTKPGYLEQSGGTSRLSSGARR